jgi:hypothetical protein
VKSVSHDSPLSRTSDSNFRCQIGCTLNLISGKNYYFCQSQLFPG